MVWTTVSRLTSDSDRNASVMLSADSDRSDRSVAIQGGRIASGLGRIRRTRRSGAPSAPPTGNPGGTCFGTPFATKSNRENDHAPPRPLWRVKVFETSGVREGGAAPGDRHRDRHVERLAGGPPTQPDDASPPPHRVLRVATGDLGGEHEQVGEGALAAGVRADDHGERREVDGDVGVAPVVLCR
jgi:hypothetical protein